MKVEKIEPISWEYVQKIMASNKLTEAQKTQFVRTNRVKIKEVIETKITSAEFKGLMENRPLQKFRPLKNSYTKMGDKIILAKALGIEPSQVADHIKNIANSMKDVDNLDFLSIDNFEMIKSYVYRHGTKDELVAFLDYELTKSKHVVDSLYKNLNYYAGGIADYFIRPIHRMDNKTLVKLYNVIDKHINISRQNGIITDEESKKLAEWTLIQIYKIQNNSKLINAIKTYKTIK
ncbi:hypothetical protein J6A31_02330 [bacterium]|nr:hypothetical protein [bacterium]